MGSKVEDIRWSRRSYTLREALKRCTFPQIMRVSVGFVSSDDNESLSKDQIFRVHQIHTQTRVLASIKKNKWLSIPLRYADARFEVITGKKRSKAMYMRDVIDRALLPQEVSFYLGDELTFDLQTAKGSVAEKLSPLVLKNMYEVCYLQGNAIYHNHLDTQVVNIPLYLPIEVNLAEGFTKHSVEQWGRYQSLLEKLVSKHVTFELFPGNQNITFFSDKRLEKADTQEDYEKIWPSGTLYVTSARERLRNKTTTTTGASGSRTVGHTPVTPSAGARGAGAASPGRPLSVAQPVTKNGDAGKTKQMAKSASASVMMSTDTVPRKAQPTARMVSREDPLPPARSLAAVNATMPRSILQKGSPGQDTGRNNVPVQPPPIPTSARPTRDSPAHTTRTGSSGQNHTPGNSNAHSSPATRGREHRPPPLTTPVQGYRRRSPSVGSTPTELHGARRNRSPSVGARPEQVLVSPTGRVRKGPINAHSPGIVDAFEGRTASNSSSTDSDYEHLKASLPVHIPAPDYDPSESVFQFPGDSIKAKEAGYGPPPTPPPVSSIPSRPKRQSSAAPAPTGPPPAPLIAKAVSSSSLSSVSSASSTQTSVAPPPPPPGPPPPPPPSVLPPPPPPPDVAAPAPPSSQAPAPPAPPPPPGLDWKPPSQQASHIPVAKPQPKQIINNEPTMSTMMEELKMAQRRRMSRGTDLEDAVDGGRMFNNGISNNSPKTNPKPQPATETNELQSILKGRKASVDGNLSPAVNPLPVAPRPNRFGGIRGGNKAPPTNDTFNKVEDIPSQLKGLTVAQVAQCLRLLNLEKYIETFKKNCIDGEMMMSLSKDILRSEFGLSEFDIQKIMKFIQGWRPK